MKCAFLYSVNSLIVFTLKNVTFYKMQLKSFEELHVRHSLLKWFVGFYQRDGLIQIWKVFFRMTTCQCLFSFTLRCQSSFAWNLGFMEWVFSAFCFSPYFSCDLFFCVCSCAIRSNLCLFHLDLCTFKWTFKIN